MDNKYENIYIEFFLSFDFTTPNHIRIKHIIDIILIL